MAGEEPSSSGLRKPGAPLARLLLSAPILASEMEESAESEFFLPRPVLTLDEEAETADAAAAAAAAAASEFFLGWMISLPPSGDARSEEELNTTDRRRWPERISAAARWTARTFPATPSSGGREDVGERGWDGEGEWDGETEGERERERERDLERERERERDLEREREREEREDEVGEREEREDEVGERGESEDWDCLTAAAILFLRRPVRREGFLGFEERERERRRWARERGSGGSLIPVRVCGLCGGVERETSGIDKANKAPRQVAFGLAFGVWRLAFGG